MLRRKPSKRETCINAEEIVTFDYDMAEEDPDVVEKVMAAIESVYIAPTVPLYT